MTEATPIETAKPRSDRGQIALEWWRKLSNPLHGDPGALARLRRSRGPTEAMQVIDAIDLARRLGAVRGDGEVPGWYLRTVLDLARVLAHVREHDPHAHPMRAAGWKRFPGARREKDTEERPILSETRFRRLLLAQEGEEKLMAFVRLIALLDRKVKVDDLARDFLRWNAPESGDRVRERWAFLYYAAGTAAIDPPTDELE